MMDWISFFTGAVVMSVLCLFSLYVLAPAFVRLRWQRGRWWVMNPEVLLCLIFTGTLWALMLR